MEVLPLVRLDLCAPLLYAKAPDIEPFVYQAAERESAADRNRQEKTLYCEETLCCFELDPAQSRSIEPDRDHFLGDLIFAGRGMGNGLAEQHVPACNGPEMVQLPAGRYLFLQKREALGREACIDLAIEQQKDGLWERLKPESRLYVRYLYEDGSVVTQLFRPL
ncbi:MAG: hypothetical protein LBD48_12840 [Treponema sp.]|jgi:hypothetical protein|nr:hypothetical protein [Treponema sp.]